MERLAKESAHDAQGAVRDAILTFVPAKAMRHIRRLLKGGGAPGSEAMPEKVAEEKAAPEEVATEEEVPDQRKEWHLAEEAGAEREVARRSGSSGIDDPIYLRQKEVVEDVLAGREELRTTARKGNFGEMVTDVEMVEKGWSPLHERVVDLDGRMRQGIDHVFEKPGPPKVHLVVDSKYGAAKLAKLADGTMQMSEAWIRNRLESAVGEHLAEQIIENGYYAIVAKVGATGKVKYLVLDKNGKMIGSFRP
jgi:hypothetical protein